MYIDIDILLWYTGDSKLGGGLIPASKAQQKAVNKYMKEKYDRFLLTLRPKGRLDTIKAHAAQCGESVNGFINRAIEQAMAQDSTQAASPAGEVE